MNDSNKGPYVPAYLIKTNFWISVAGLIAIPPFVILDLIKGRFGIALAATPDIIFLVVNAYSTYHGRYNYKLVFIAMTAVAAIALSYLYITTPSHAIPWGYVFVAALYLTLPEKSAWISNAIVLAIIIPCALLNMEPEMAMRNIVTLIALSAAVAIFIRIMTTQEKQLRQLEKQRRENMANASHELRTPLATLIAQVDAMHDGIRKLDQSELGVVSRHLDHITGLVDDLFLLSLSDVSKLEFHLQRHELNELVRDTVDTMQDKLRERNQTIMLSDLPVMPVYGDSKRLNQVFVNILENCYRYSDDGAMIFIDGGVEEDRAYLSFEDSGPGVSENDLPHLFDRFYRVDKSRSRERGGSGLGLSLVKALIEAQHGQVKAYRSLQGGLGISISLPLSQE